MASDDAAMPLPDPARVEPLSDPTEGPDTGYGAAPDENWRHPHATLYRQLADRDARHRRSRAASDCRVIATAAIVGGVLALGGAGVRGMAPRRGEAAEVRQDAGDQGAPTPVADDAPEFVPTDEDLADYAAWAERLDAELRDRQVDAAPECPYGYE